MYKISRTGILLRSISSSCTLRSCGPPRLCGCTPKPKKRGFFDILLDPCGVKPDPCLPCQPPLTQNQKICKLVIIGTRVIIVGGILYWTFQQGLFSGAERRKNFFERLRAACEVLCHGPKICDPKKCPGCCKCEGGPIMQRLRAALCFLRYDAMSPSQVEDAIRCKTLPKDFRRCDSCSVPPPPPCPRKKGGFVFQAQHWAPQRCIFSKRCPCGARPPDEVVAQVMKERRYDEVEYVDDYYKILKDDEEGDGGDDSGDSKSRTSEGTSKKSQGGGGEEGGGGEDGGGDDGGGDEEEDVDAASEEEEEEEEEEEA